MWSEGARGWLLGMDQWWPTLVLSTLCPPRPQRFSAQVDIQINTVQDGVPTIPICRFTQGRHNRIGVGLGHRSALSLFFLLGARAWFEKNTTPRLNSQVHASPELGRALRSSPHRQRKKSPLTGRVLRAPPRSLAVTSPSCFNALHNGQGPASLH